MNIREALVSDSETLYEIEKACFDTPWSSASFAQRLGKSGYVFLICEDETSSPMGYMGLQYVLDEGYILNVATLPQYRRLGVAQMLIAAMKERALALELSFLTLEVRESNEAARRLYERQFFECVGVRKNYYEKPTEHAVLMTLMLTPSADCKGFTAKPN